MASMGILLVQRRNTTPPGILKQVEKAAEEHREERALEATSSVSPTSSPPAGGSSSSEIIDTFSTSHELESQAVAQTAAPATDKELGSWLNNTFVLHEFNGQSLLRVNPTIELGISLVAAIITIAVLISIEKVMSRVRRHRRRPKIRRISLE